MFGTAGLLPAHSKTLRISALNKQILPQGPFLVQNNHPSKGKLEKKGDSWNQQQRSQYWAFLLHFEKQMQRISNKEMWVLYKLMSQFVKTRNPNQCRIQHLRMLKEHGELRSLLAIGRRECAGRFDYINQYETELRVLTLGLEMKSPPQGQTNNKDGSLQAIQEFKYNNKEDRQLFFNRQIIDDVEEIQKKQNQDNIRTDLTYHDEENVENQQPNPAARRHWQPDPYQSNHYPPAHSQPYGSFSDYYPYPDPFHFATSLSSFNMCPPQSAGDNQLAEWMECHQLFLSWTSKLKKLTEKS